MKHLRLFKTESEYNLATLELPNVSYVEDNDMVYYHPMQESEDYVMVDLGLPSGLLWADRNIGAANPEDYGLYFQWGNPTGYTAEQVTNGEKSFNFFVGNYFDTHSNGGTFNKYAIDKLTVLEASDDAASINMGSDWRMPTYVEIEELIVNTTHTFIDIQGNEFSQDEVYYDSAIAQNNLKGVKFTGSNGNSIFIPASGYCYHSTIGSIGSAGCLWSSDLDIEVNYDDDSSTARVLYFDCIYGLDIDVFDSAKTRCEGMSVRGVKSK